MDLAAGAKTVYVMTRHTTKQGAPKLLLECSLPVTGRGVVSRVYTELGIFDVDHGSFLARGLVAGVGLGDVQAQTEAPVVAAVDCVRLPRRAGCP
jgi:3-oxoacid CoA-transferase B subunit